MPYPNSVQELYTLLQPLHVAIGFAAKPLWDVISKRYDRSESHRLKALPSGTAWEAFYSARVAFHRELGAGEPSAVSKELRDAIDVGHQKTEPLRRSYDLGAPNLVELLAGLETAIDRRRAFVSADLDYDDFSGQEREALTLVELKYEVALASARLQSTFGYLDVVLFRATQNKLGRLVRWRLRRRFESEWKSTLTACREERARERRRAKRTVDQHRQGYRGLTPGIDRRA